MKKYKLLILAIFFVLVFFTTNTIFAKDITYTAWRYDVNQDGKLDLVFRRYYVVDDDTVKEYHKQSGYEFFADDIKYKYKDKWYTTKWVTPKGKGVIKPEVNEYTTIGYTFHTGKYNSSYISTNDQTKGIAGYITNTKTNNISTKDDIKDYIEDVAIQRQVVNEGTISNIYEMYGVKGAFADVTYGTGINISSITPKEQMVYRYAITTQTINENELNIYIEDRVIYYDELKELRQKQKDKNVEDDPLYISDIVISKSLHTNGGYELSKTLYQFFKQYNKNGQSANIWDEKVLGLDSEISDRKTYIANTNSVINVFDNKIELPQTSKRHVIVRYCNTGTSTTISCSDYISLKASENSEYEIYEDVEQTADEIKKTSSVYRPIGYNVSYGITEENAIIQANSKITAGKYELGEKVTIAGLPDESESEYVIIDFYYRNVQKSDIVKVNHLYVDENGIIKKDNGSYNVQKIVAGEEAYIGEGYTIPVSAITNRFATTYDFQSQYYSSPGQNMLVRTAKNVLDERLENKLAYIGYELFNEDIDLNKLYGYKTNPKTDWYKPNDEMLGVVVKQGVKVVNIYYYKYDDELQAVPSKFLSMTYATQTTDLCTNCKDDSEKEITSIPSGSKLKVGITQIARVLASAIEIEYIKASENIHEIDIKATYTLGNQQIQAVMNNVQVSFGYYKITELLLDALEEVIQYDEKANKITSNKDDLFSWTGSKLIKTFNMDSKTSIEVKGKDTIADANKDGIFTAAEISNWKKYVDIELKDKYNSKTEVKETKEGLVVNLNNTFLTEQEMEEVDANGDGKVTEEDKIFAQNKVEEYSKSLDEITDVINGLKVIRGENLDKQCEFCCGDDCTKETETITVNGVSKTVTTSVTCSDEPSSSMSGEEAIKDCTDKNGVWDVECSIAKCKDDAECMKVVKDKAVDMLVYDAERIQELRENLELAIGGVERLKEIRDMISKIDDLDLSQDTSDKRLQYYITKNDWLQKIMNSIGSIDTKKTNNNIAAAKIAGVSNLSGLLDAFIEGKVDYDDVYNLVYISGIYAFQEGDKLPELNQLLNENAEYTAQEWIMRYYIDVRDTYNELKVLYNYPSCTDSWLHEFTHGWTNYCDVERRLEKSKNKINNIVGELDDKIGSEKTESTLLYNIKGYNDYLAKNKDEKTTYTILKSDVKYNSVACDEQQHIDRKEDSIIQCTDITEYNIKATGEKQNELDKLVNNVGKQGLDKLLNKINDDKKNGLINTIDSLKKIYIKALLEQKLSEKNLEQLKFMGIIKDVDNPGEYFDEVNKKLNILTGFMGQIDIDEIEIFISQWYSYSSLNELLDDIDDIDNISIDEKMKYMDNNKVLSDVNKGDPFARLYYVMWLLWQTFVEGTETDVYLTEGISYFDKLYLARKYANEAKENNNDMQEALKIMADKRDLNLHWSVMILAQDCIDNGDWLRIRRCNFAKAYEKASSNRSDYNLILDGVSGTIATINNYGYDYQDFVEIPREVYLTKQVEYYDQYYALNSLSVLLADNKTINPHYDDEKSASVEQVAVRSMITLIKLLKAQRENQKYWDLYKKYMDETKKQIGAVNEKIRQYNMYIEKYKKIIECQAGDGTSYKLSTVSIGNISKVYEETVNKIDSFGTTEIGDIKCLKDAIAALNTRIGTQTLPNNNLAIKYYEEAKNAEEVNKNEELIDEEKCNYYKALVAENNTAIDIQQATKEDIQNKYNAAVSYKNNLYNKYNSYKTNYDNFAELKEKEYGIDDSTLSERQAFAKAAQMQMILTAYNMQVKIKTDSTSKDLINPSYVSSTTGWKDMNDILASGITINAPEIKIESSLYTTGISPVQLSDYTDSHSIDATKQNGIRTLSGDVKYNTKSYITKDTKATKITDNVYYSSYTGNKTKGVFDVNKNTKVQNSINKQVNVYTPILVSATLKSDSLINQAGSTVSEAQTIQLSAPFTVTFGNSQANPNNIAYSDTTDTSKYCKAYYIKFDFDVHNVQYYSAATGTTKTSYNSLKKVPAGTWIGPITKRSSGDTTLTAKVYTGVSDVDVDIAREENGSYVVRAVAYNATSSMMKSAAKYTDILEVMNSKDSLKDIVTNICTSTSTIEKNIPSYFIDKTYDNVYLLNRVYDFRVTDVKDVNWKNVFRKNTGDKINVHTGNVYYSGISKWIFDKNDKNKIVNRTTSEIGANPTRTLPIGPYKNTDETYTKAPKLGYGFSFDLKVTGSYYKSDGTPNTNKKVVINPTFYYISNDGNDIYKESTGGEGIYLFYKNDSGKYVRIGSSSDDYKLTFVPNDGYRLLTTDETITLSKKTLTLGNLKTLTLTHEMATVEQTYTTQQAANNGTVITYYGEYKLPSSTIAVKVDSLGKYDINKPLKDGYIGVIFDIKAVVDGPSGGKISLSYSQNTNGTNTSQWDYEGYLGMKIPVTTYSTTKLKLEGANTSIDNTKYDKIKGTVILYDIDERASDDYQ